MKVKKISLKSVIALILGVFALTIIIFISIISNNVIKKNFNNYISERIESNKESVINKVKSTYKDGNWNLEEIERIGKESLEKGLILKITNKQSEVIWDSNDTYYTMCQFMLDEMRQNAEKCNINDKVSYIEEEIDLSYDNNFVGILKIGHNGPVYYNNSDVVFFKSLNMALLIVSFIAMILSIFIGIILSYKINKPIISVVNTSKKIIEGKYDNNLKPNNIKEIDEMINSINILSLSLGKEEEMRKRLSKDISHELRTPLSNIRLQLEAIIDGILEPTKERFLGIDSELYRLSNLVSSLEELTKYDDNNLKLNKEIIYTRDFINNILINFEKQFYDRGINIICECEDCKVNIDKDKISQAIVNLISNSIKYTTRGDFIKIKLFSDLKNNIIIIIEDSGLGIDEFDIEHIFKRFYKGDKSRTRNSDGAGIGLSITQSIVHAHNGTINVESEKNKGTKFTIKIPIV